MADNSKPMSLNSTDMNNVLRSGLIFLSGLALMYITQIIGVIQTPNHLFSFGDLIPNTFTQGGMILYILNRLTDIIRKFVA